MKTEHPELDEMQRAYKAAVEKWIAAIRNEEHLASANHTLAQVDKWEQAHFDRPPRTNNAAAATGMTQPRRSPA